MMSEFGVVVRLRGNAADIRKDCQTLIKGEKVMSVSMDAKEWKRLAGWVKHGLADNPTAAVEVNAVSADNTVSLRVVGDTVAEAHATAEVTEDLAVALPGKLFTELLRTVATGTVVVRAPEEGNSVIIDAGRSTFTLPCAVVPQVAVTQPQTFGTVDAAAFAKVVGQVAPSADVSGGGALSAVLLSPDSAAGALTLVATNRYRMAVASVPYVPAGDANDDSDVLLSAKTVAGQVKAVTAETLTLQRSDGTYGFAGDNESISGRLISGAYAPWERAMSMADNSTISATVSAPDLLGAVKRCGLVARLGQSDAASGTFELVDGQIRLTAGSGSVGEAEEFVAVEQAGDNVTVRMNLEYVAAGLHAAGDEKVMFQFSGPQRAVLMTTLPEDHTTPFRYLIMPLAT
jgi:DNA polymerase-3 subunit beta